MRGRALALGTTLLLAASGVMAQPAPEPAPGLPPTPTAAPPPAPTTSVAPPVALDERVLVLCFSRDVMAREYCLLQIVEHGQASPEKVEPTLRRMATRDVALHDQAGALYRRLFPGNPAPIYQGPPPTTEPPPTWGGPITPDVEGEEPKNDHATAGDTTRVIFAPTAYVRPAGDVGLNFFQIGSVSVDYGIADVAQIGARTALPIGVLPFTLNGRLSYPFEYGAVGINAEFGLVWPFLFSDDNPVILVGGGGPTLTLGNANHYFNVGVMEFGAGLVGAGGGAADVFLPHIGASFRVAEVVRLGLEGYLLGSLSAPELFGEGGAIMAGVRFFGEWIWGDVALLEPICGPCVDLYEVIPVGIPFLNFGMAL